MKTEKRHFLVVASASRGARFFVKKALSQGHDVRALCRAENDAAALQRMQDLLASTVLTPGGPTPHVTSGKLTARNSNILKPETYADLLSENPSIDAICCFVGVTKMKAMMSSKTTLYTDTIRAIVRGQENSRWVETFYHGSVGTEGVPGEGVTAWPANYYPFSNVTQLIFPVFKDVTRSEAILAEAQSRGLEFVIFRPSRLFDGPAKRQYGYSFDTTGLDKEDLPLRYAKRSISREDTAEEILRVATLPTTERAKWHGHGIYLVDMKEKYFVQKSKRHFSAASASS